MQLKSSTIPSEGSILSSQPSLCFKINICVGLKNYKSFFLLDLGVLSYFLNKEFVKRHRIPLIKKKLKLYI